MKRIVILVSVMLISCLFSGIVAAQGSSAGIRKQVSETGKTRTYAGTGRVINNNVGAKTIPNTTAKVRTTAKAKARATTKAKNTTKTKTIKILLIGNSLTASNGGQLGYSLKQLAEAAGYKVKISCVAYNGEKLETYANAHTARGKAVREKIRSKKWDYVILQQHTKRLVARRGSTKRAVQTLEKYIHKYSPKAKVLLRSTWPYLQHKYIYDKWYSYSEQRKRMKENSKAIAKSTGVEVIWSGSAFHKYRKTYDHVALYQWDRNHGTEAGYYLDACCIFAKIFGKSPYKVKYYGSFGKTEALRLQKCAAETNK